VIDMSSFHHFPSADTSKIYILEQGEVNSSNAPVGENLPITSSEQLNFNYIIPRIIPVTGRLAWCLSDQEYI